MVSARGSRGVYLEKTSDPNRSLHYTAVALEREGHRVVLHTHKTNEVARFLMENGSIPELGEHQVVRHRFRMDWLLEKYPSSESLT